MTIAELMQRAPVSAFTFKRATREEVYAVKRFGKQTVLSAKGVPAELTIDDLAADDWDFVTRSPGELPKVRLW